ncbi:MAG: nucleoside triphosphate pyrophosphohydrolase [Eubacteriaceae bacterium]|nr:nucleoside triphosphate pyrophosphohydrolase [Eubacteriaceae bacterium]
MKQIYILGFGCADRSEITLGTIDTLKKSDMVYVRTMQHPAAVILDEFNIPYIDFDNVYDRSETFEDVYEKIADTVINAPAEVVSYIVPGSAVFAEKAVQIIVRKATCPVKIIPAVSFLDGIFAALKMDAIESFKLIDALDIINSKPDVSTTNIIAQVYDRDIASDVKLELMNYYDDEFEVFVIVGAAAEDEKVIPVKICEMDYVEEIDHLTSVVVPPALGEHGAGAFESLYHVIKELRGENGCEWDKAQTHESLVKYLIEESYEFIDAIKNSDPYGMCEELGDVLLQIILHAVIAEEEGEFMLSDIIRDETKKMIRRHPHVFSEDRHHTDWEEIKKEEHQYKNTSQSMSEIPRSLPAIIYADKIQSKAAKVGFDFDDALQAMDKLYEEADEVIEAVKENIHVMEECGDLLFAAINVVRLAGVDPYEALSHANDKFFTRFSLMERLIEENGQHISEMSVKEADVFWEKAKKMLNSEKNS